MEKEYQIIYVGTGSDGEKVVAQFDIKTDHFPSIGQTILEGMAEHARTISHLECPFEVTSISRLI